MLWSVVRGFPETRTVRSIYIFSAAGPTVIVSKGCFSSLLGSDIAKDQFGSMLDSCCGSGFGRWERRIALSMRTRSDCWGVFLASPTSLKANVSGWCHFQVMSIRSAPSQNGAGDVRPVTCSRQQANGLWPLDWRKGKDSASERLVGCAGHQTGENRASISWPGSSPFVAPSDSQYHYLGVLLPLTSAPYACLGAIDCFEQCFQIIQTDVPVWSWHSESEWVGS